MLGGARACAGAIVEVVADADVARVPAVALPGAHQRRNAAAAIAAVRAAGVPVDDDALAHVVHPGRFERALGDLILDGAHNPHGARALAATLRELAPAARARRRDLGRQGCARDRRCARRRRLGDRRDALSPGARAIA